jgi:methionine--tRNA ligase beta chain
VTRPASASASKKAARGEARMNLRIGEIVAAEALRGSTRLLRVEVDLGGERRVLVAGLAQHYGPEALVGLKVVVLANLAPAVGQSPGAERHRRPVIVGR